MTWIILLVCIFLILTDNRRVIPVYLIASMWINFDVRCGSISLISLLSAFVIVLGIITRRRNLVFATDMDSAIKSYLVYAVLINVPFILLSTDLSVWSQLNNLKSQILSIILLAVIWKWKPYDISVYKRHGMYFNASIIILCIYGIYTYLTMTNPYMDIMGQYCTNEGLSDLLARSMEDARGNLHGRITGTSLYTIQYGILLVITFFVHKVFCPLYNGKNLMLIIMALIFVNLYLTGSRGPLIGLLIGLIFYWMCSFNWKNKIAYALMISIFLLVGWPYLESYFSLFTADDISGSSVEGRSVQFGGALSMVSDDLQSLLFGKGQGYTSYYLKKYGLHPLALKFESVHVSGIVNYGVLGLLFIFLGNIMFLGYLALKAYKKDLIGTKHFYLLVSFILSYFIYNVLVGNVYNSLFVISFFISLKMGMLQYNECKKNVYEGHKDSCCLP